MKTNSKKLLKTQTIAGIIISMFLAFLFTSLPLLIHSHFMLRKNYTNTIFLEAERKTLELNNFFNSAERIVHNYSDYILNNLDEKKLLSDPDYENEFMSELTTIMSSTALTQKGIVCTFFRLESTTFGPNRGIFLTGGYQKRYVSVRTTDLSIYSPTDTEHVGWYYLPIWNKAPLWTPPYENPNIRQQIISYCIPLYRNNKLLGVVGADLSLAIIQDMVNSLHIESSKGLLIGKEQNLIQLNSNKDMTNSVERSAELVRILENFQEANEQKLIDFLWQNQIYTGILKNLDNGMSFVTSVSQKEIRSLIYKQIIALIFSFIAVSIITVILIFFALNKIIIPLKTISKTTNRLARGELYIDFPYNSENEIGILANNIRMMTSQMKEYIEYISEQTKKERAAKEAALTESHINAAASQAKSAFLANMSHEIRTPINAVLGMNEMILRESKDKTILGYASNIKTAGANLLSIVNDVLDFSKIEAGKMELLPDNYEVSSLIIDILNMTRERAKSKGLEYEINITSALPKTLFGDSVRIKQCILNLLTNAIKYTQKGKISFTIDYKGYTENSILLKFIVQDTGCGIKKEDMQKLFAPFERIDEEKNRTIEGSGLGISIVRRLLNMMNSKLEVRSEYGKGSEFSFEVEQKVTDWTTIGNINEAYSQSLNQISSYKETLYAPKAKLLFVDDTEMNLDVIKGLLKNTGMLIDTVLSGKEALEAVRQTKYDILFIDHRMPEMDGIETLHLMKTMKDNLCIDKPCIALTANAISGVRKMYLDEGFDDYLSKPVNPAKLEDMIRHYLPQDYIEEKADSLNSNSTPFSDLIDQLKQTDGLDTESALENCRTAENLLSTIKKYHSSIDERSSEIQQYFDKEDWQNYEIKVHALKSTSRLIGARELSELAEQLENCAEKKDITSIKKEHKKLIKLFKSYKKILEPFATTNDLSTDKSEKKEISKEELTIKAQKMLDYANDFNIDGLDALLKELSNVNLPLDFSDKFDKIRKSIENVDFKELRVLLKEWSIN